MSCEVEELSAGMEVCQLVIPFVVVEYSCRDISQNGYFFPYYFKREGFFNCLHLWLNVLLFYIGAEK